MKKIFYLGIILFSLCIFIAIPVHANEEPYYDSKYNNNAGAFYANGNDVSIEEEGSKTVVKWWGGKQELPISATVFGGGQKGTHFENANITMNGGNIFCVVGGGVSTDEQSGTIVENANITINGGKISGNVVGGGYLYSQVYNSNITINNGTIEAILGGGFATIMIDKQIYNVGTATEAENSPNRVNKVNIEINNVTMPPPEFHTGIIYGGGHGYAYVGETNLTINEGEMPSVYVTAGGTDGYTGKANVTINGGNIYLYQSVNKGIVENVTTKITGGNIEKFYVGAETSDSSTIGVMKQCDIYLMEGKIENLGAGKNNSAQLKIDKDIYKVIQSDDIEITNDSIPEEDKIRVSYYLEIYPKHLIVLKDQLERINAMISVVPEEYEYLFLDDIKWEAKDTSIVSVLDDGVVSGINPGTTEVTASFLKKTETAQVTVIEADAGTIIPIIIVAIFLLCLLFIIIVLIFVPFN